MLKVSNNPDGSPEIFYSIQGEGVNSGRPAVFLRLSLCNLKCTWCDTKYTWDWDNYDPQKQIVEMQIEGIQREIIKYNCKYLVVSGGEPLVQQKQLIPLLILLKASSYFIEIETNATIIPNQKMLSLVDHWSLSPKLQNSGNPQNLREISECYRLFADMASSHFKYTVQNNDDFGEIHTLAQKYKITPQKIILMPEATNKEELLEKSSWIIDFCKAHGYLFSARLHILFWGNKKGYLDEPSRCSEPL